jgi:hypothetical protein
MGLLLALGALTKLPIYNLGPSKSLSFSPSEEKTLAKLSEAVEIEVFLSPLGETRFGPVLALYARYPHITVKKNYGSGQAEVNANNFQLALPDRAIIRSGPYVETVSPLSQLGLRAAFFRLTSPSRVVYNLVGDGEKSVQDPSPLGMSLWSQHLERQKIFLRDHIWAPNAPLPQGGAALILASPKTALSEDKNAALIHFLAQGGRLLALQDPLTLGIDPAAFQDLGLTLAQGLVVDPETAWAGTDDLFPVNFDFPAHPATIGLSQPVVWPMAGAILAAENLPEPEPTEANNPLAGSSWAVARSSPESYLETDRVALAERRPKLDPELDPAGPLILATASALASGGRLALLADSDLAANLFITNPGNLAFMDNLIYWLLGAEDGLPTAPQGTFFNVTQNRARAMFWLPVVVWPLFATLVWLIYYQRRRAA